MSSRRTDVHTELSRTERDVLLVGREVLLKLARIMDSGQGFAGQDPHGLVEWALADQRRITALAALAVTLAQGSELGASHLRQLASMMYLDAVQGDAR